MAVIARILMVCGLVLAVGPVSAASKVSGCALNGKALYGKVQVVKSVPDFKVQIVHSFADLKVMRVTSFPDTCGKWQFVNSFPDFTIEYVDGFPDFTVEFVESFPGEI